MYILTSYFFGKNNMKLHYNLPSSLGSAISHAFWWEGLKWVNLKLNQKQLEREFVGC